MNVYTRSAKSAVKSIIGPPLNLETGNIPIKGAIIDPLRSYTQLTNGARTLALNNTNNIRNPIKNSKILKMELVKS